MGKQQRGGTLLGLIIGVILGLAIGLGVAVYVTKVPIPFKSGDAHFLDNKGNGGDGRIQDWNPNGPLTEGMSQRPGPAVPPPVVPAPAADPVVLPPAASADPLGDLANAQLRAAEAKAAAAASATSPAAADGFHYFVQAGAFRQRADADAQRAKLAMLGMESRISEREQNGRVVFRVRVGPFEGRDAAAQAKHKLDAAGVESTLVRVQQ